MVDLSKRFPGDKVYLEGRQGLFELTVEDPKVGYVSVDASLPCIQAGTKAYLRKEIALGSDVVLDFGNGALKITEIISIRVKGDGWEWDF